MKKCPACGRENPEILSVCRYCKGKLGQTGGGDGSVQDAEIEKKLGTICFRYDNKGERLDFGFWLWVIYSYLAVCFLSILKWRSIIVVLPVTGIYVFGVWGYWLFRNRKRNLFYVGEQGFLIRDYLRKNGKILSDAFYFYKDFTDVYYPATIHRNLVKTRMKKTYSFEIYKGEELLYYQDGTFWSENSDREMFLQKLDAQWSAYLVKKFMEGPIPSGGLAVFKDKDGKTVKIGIGRIVKDEVVFRPEEVEKYIFIGGDLSIIGKGYKWLSLRKNGKHTVIHVNKLSNKTVFMLLLQSLMKAEIEYHEMV